MHRPGPQKGIIKYNLDNWIVDMCNNPNLTQFPLDNSCYIKLPQIQGQVNIDLKTQ